MGVAEKVTDKRLILSQIMAEELPDELSSYFNEAITEREFMVKLEDYMGNWYIDHRGTVDLSDPKNLVLYILEENVDIAATIEQVEPVYLKFVDNRRSSKKNWFNKIKKEYEEIKEKGSSKGLLSADADSYFSLKTMHGPVSGSFTNKEEYIKERYEQIQAWQKDKETSLLSFMYFRMLPPNSRVKAFMIEVSYYIFKSLATEMYGNVTDGYVATVPRSVNEIPAFSYQQNSFDSLDFTYENGIGNFFNEYFLKSDSKVRTIVKSVEMSEEEASNVSLIQSLKDNFNISEGAKSLDPVDFQVLQTICSNFNAALLLNGTITLSLKTLAKQFYNKSSGIRGRDYLYLIKRINKLAEYTLSATRRNSETNIVEKIILHFMDVHFQIPTNNRNEVRNIDREISRILDEKNEDLEDVSMDISETILNIVPGKSITDAWKTNAIQRVYFKNYNQIEDSKSKLFLTIMETERLKLYPETTEVLDISFFLNKLQFNMVPRKVRTAITDSLRSLVDKKIVIMDFNFVDKTHIKIDYIPVTSTEKMVYGIEE